MDASLCHQKSSEGLYCSHPRLMAAVNFMALPRYLPQHRRDAASRRGLEKSSRGRNRGVWPS